MSTQHFFKPNGTQKDLVWSIIFRNGFANGKRWEIPTLFSHTDATTGADVVTTVQRLYPGNNNIKDFFNFNYHKHTKVEVEDKAVKERKQRPTQEIMAFLERFKIDTTEIECG